ncbi:MAG: hypothetical protein ACK47L_04535, partial [Pseudanabaena sp.]
LAATRTTNRPILPNPLIPILSLAICCLSSSSILRRDHASLSFMSKCLEILDMSGIEYKKLINFKL